MHANKKNCGRDMPGLSEMSKYAVEVNCNAIESNLQLQLS